MATFMDGLDDLLGVDDKPKQEPKDDGNPFGDQEPAERPASVADAAPEEDPEFEPVKPPDEWDLPAPGPDEYTKQMDAILAGEGIDVEKELRRRYDPAKGNLQAHDWESVREAIFEGEPFEFRCKRCGKYVHVRRGHFAEEGEEDDDTLDANGNPVGTQYDAQGNPVGTVYDANGEPIPPDPAIAEAAKKEAEEKEARDRLCRSSAAQMNALDALLGLEPEKIETKKLKTPKFIDGETIEEALVREGVDPNCAYAVVRDVTDE